MSECEIQDIVYDGLPVILNAGAEGWRMRDNFNKSFENAMLCDNERIISGDIIYNISIDDGCLFIQDRRKDWDPITMLTDEQQKAICSDNTGISFNQCPWFHFVVITTYQKARVVQQAIDSCANLDPILRLFDKQCLQQTTPVAPVVEFDMVAKQGRMYLLNDRQPYYFVSNFKGLIYAKEHKTNMIHIFDKNFHETVVVHKNVHPHGDLVSYPDGTLVQLIKFDDYNKNCDTTDPYYMEIMDRTVKSVFIPQSLNKPCYNTHDLDLVFYDFAHVMMILTNDISNYNEINCRKLRLQLESYLTPNDIAQELLYIIDCKLVELRGQQLISTINNDVNLWFSSSSFDQRLINMRTMSPVEWNLWLEEQQQQEQQNRGGSDHISCSNVHTTWDTDDKGKIIEWGCSSTPPSFTPPSTPPSLIQQNDDVHVTSSSPSIHYHPSFINPNSTLSTLNVNDQLHELPVQTIDSSIYEAHERRVSVDDNSVDNIDDDDDSDKGTQVKYIIRRITDDGDKFQDYELVLPYGIRDINHPPTMTKKYDISHATLHFSIMYYKPKFQHQKMECKFFFDTTQPPLIYEVPW